MGYITIIAYVYEADVHCVACAVKRFRTINPEEVNIIGVYDINGIPYQSIDNEGNQIGVDFEGTEVDMHQACGDCGESIHNFSIIHDDDLALQESCDCSECQPCEECWQ